MSSRLVSDGQILRRVWPALGISAEAAEAAAAAQAEAAQAALKAGAEAEALDGWVQAADGSWAYEPEGTEVAVAAGVLPERSELSLEPSGQQLGGDGAAAVDAGSSGDDGGSRGEQPADGMGVGARVRSEFGDGVVRFRGSNLAFSEGEWVGVELDGPDGRNSGAVQGVQYFRCRPDHGLFAPPGKLELLEPVGPSAGSDGHDGSDGSEAEEVAEMHGPETVPAQAASGGGAAAVAEEAAEEAEVDSSRGEKPWYRAQHEAAARARSTGTLLERQSVAVSSADGGDAAVHELWQSGDDLVALLVEEEEGGASGCAVASVVYRPGPLSADMREMLDRLLPRAGGGWRPWRRQSVRKLAGMVHVYVEPGRRGAARGETLVRYSIGAIGRQGYSHALTLADDRGGVPGSGKLVEWYQSIGFVIAPEFEAPGETAMVAVVESSR